jgi:diguanylate cyclase (GGDEF)-like protein
LRGLHPAQLQAVAEIMARLITEPDVNVVYEGIMDGARELLDADRCAVFGVNPDANTLECLASVGLSASFLSVASELSPQNPVAAPLSRLDMSVFEDIETDPRTMPVLDLLRPAGFRAAIVSPMVFDGKLVGALTLFYDGPRRIPETERCLVRFFASLAAAAGENGRVHTENALRAERLKVLDDISLAVSSTLDLNSLYRTVYEHVSHVLKLDAFYIALYDSQRDEVRWTFHADRGAIDASDDKRPLANGPCAWVIRNRKPFFLVPENAHVQHRGLKFGSGDHCASAIHVPMLIGSGVVGVMSVQSYTADAYDEHDLHLLQTVATHTAVSIENARLYALQTKAADENRRLLNQSAARAERLAAINEVGLAVSRVLDPEQLYQVVYERMTQVIKADCFYIAWWNRETRRISFPFEIDGGKRRYSDDIELDDGLTSWVIRNGRPRIENDVPQLVAAEGIVMGAAPKSLSTLHVPMTLGGEIVGVMSAQSCELNSYDDEDVQMLLTVAGQTAVAFQNARLFAAQNASLQENQRLTRQSEARAARLEVLNEVGLAVSRVLDLESLYQVVYDQLRRALTVDAFYISIWDPERDEIVAGVCVDRGEWHRVERSKAVGNGPSRWVISTAKPYFLTPGDAATHAAATTFGSTERSRSAIYVPMMLGNRVVGVLSAQSYSPGVYSEDDIALVQAVATQTAVAIENARLFSAQKRALDENVRLNKQSEARADRLAVLNEVGVAVSRVLEVDELYEVAYLQCRRALEVDSFYIALWEPAQARVSLPFISDLGVRQPACSVLFGDNVCCSVIRDGRSRLLNNSEEIASVDGDTFGSGSPSQSIILVPMRLGRQVLGVISVQSYKPNAYTPEDVLMLETLAGQTAVALENARLFSTQAAALDENARLHAASTRMAERLQVLNQAGVALSGSLEIEQLYRAVFEQTARLLHLDDFYIALWRPESETLAFWIFEKDKPEYRDVVLPITEGPSGWVIRNRRPLLVLDENDPVSARGSFIGSGGDTSSAIHVPLMLGERIIGVMSAQAACDNAYTQEDVQILETLAGQAAVAVENARLYRAVQEASLTDELTGLPNRRAIAGRVDDELSRAARYGYSLCVLILDLDFFKLVNDTHGHPAGDEVLRELSLLLRGSLRSHDALGRWGGEEFLVLLVHTDIAGGRVVAENLRKRVEAHKFLDGRLEQPLTISIGGIAIEPPAQWLTADVVNEADASLYQAKATGRNRVVFEEQ